MVGILDQLYSTPDDVAAAQAGLTGAISQRNQDISGPLQESIDLIRQQQARGDTQSMAGLGFAAGLLSPTRTGAFGESLGNAFSGAMQPIKEQRALELSRAEMLNKISAAKASLGVDLAQQKLNAAVSPLDVATKLGQAAPGLANYQAMTDYMRPGQRRADAVTAPDLSQPPQQMTGMRAEGGADAREQALAILAKSPEVRDEVAKAAPAVLQQAKATQAAAAAQQPVAGQAPPAQPQAIPPGAAAAAKFQAQKGAPGTLAGEIAAARPGGVAAAPVAGAPGTLAGEIARARGAPTSFQPPDLTVPVAPGGPPVPGAAPAATNLALPPLSPAQQPPGPSQAPSAPAAAPADVQAPGATDVAGPVPPQVQEEVDKNLPKQHIQPSATAAPPAVTTVDPNDKMLQQLYKNRQDAYDFYQAHPASSWAADRLNKAQELLTKTPGYQEQEALAKERGKSAGEIHDWENSIGQKQYGTRDQLLAAQARGDASGITPAAKAQLEEVKEWEKPIMGTLDKIETARGAMTLIGNLNVKEHTGTWAEQRADFINKLQTLGFASNAAMEHASGLYEFQKIAVKKVFEDLKEQGGRVLVSEIEGLSKGNPNLGLTPQANAAIIGQGKAALDRSQARLEAYLGAKAQDPDGFFARAPQFLAQWTKEHKFGEFMQRNGNQPYYGQAPGYGGQIPEDPKNPGRPDVNRMIDGQLYQGRDVDNPKKIIDMWWDAKRQVFSKQDPNK